MATQSDYGALLEALDSGGYTPDIDSLLDQNPQMSLAEEPDYSALLQDLEQKVAQGPMTFEEYAASEAQNDKRSIFEKTLAFGESAIIGGSALIDEGKNAVKEVYKGDVGWDEIKGVFDVGVEDLKQFGSTVMGAAKDMVFANDEEALRNSYNRYRENFEYYQNQRPELIEEYTTDAPSFVSFGANFVDPATLVPFVGPAAKLGSVTLKSAKLGKMAKMMDMVEKTTSLPAKGLAKGGRFIVKEGADLASRVAGGIGKIGQKADTLRTKVAGGSIGAGTMMMGSPMVGVGIGTFTVFAPKIAKHTGKGMRMCCLHSQVRVGKKDFYSDLP